MPQGVPFLFQTIIMLQSYLLTNAQSSIEILNWGATVKSWIITRPNGEKLDLVLGFNNAERYQKKHPSFGCVVGRYANRIAQGKFTLNKKEYQLDINNGPNHLHGGLERFGNRYWKVLGHNEHMIKMAYLSPDGESSYPGRLEAELVYELSEDNRLSIKYTAKSDVDTLCNLTNHSYFNLNGESSGSILNHSFQILADHFLPTDKTSIPTGVYQAVENTVMDLRNPRKLEDLNLADNLLENTKGFDHNYVLGRHPFYRLVAIAKSDVSGLQLECHTDQPGLQFYTANTLADVENKTGGIYHAYDGFCFEAQHFPDAPNNSHFPSPILRKGEVYTQSTSYKISGI